MKLKKAILFDGTQVSKKYNWDREFIIFLETQIKENLICKYGKENIHEDFQLIVFTLAKLNENNIVQIKLDNSGIEECNWLTSFLEKKYNQFPCDNIIDETGTFIDETIIFCDYWWKNLDTDILSKYATSKSDFDGYDRIDSSIIDEIFQLSVNNPNVIFIPYDLYTIENSFEYGKQRESEESTACKIVYPFTFGAKRDEISSYFEDVILDLFPDKLPLLDDKSENAVKILVNKRNREDDKSYLVSFL